MPASPVSPTSPRIPCATASAKACSTAVWTSSPWPPCWATAGWKRPPCTRTRAPVTSSMRCSGWNATPCHAETPPQSVGNQGRNMSRQLAVVLYLVLLAASVVVVDVLFFRHQFWARLLVNIGIVLVFVVFYWIVLKRP